MHLPIYPNPPGLPNLAFCLLEHSRLHAGKATLGRSGRFEAAQRLSACQLAPHSRHIFGVSTAVFNHSRFILFMMTSYNSSGKSCCGPHPKPRSWHRRLHSVPCLRVVITQKSEPPLLTPGCSGVKRGCGGQSA